MLTTRPPKPSVLAETKPSWSLEVFFTDPCPTGPVPSECKGLVTFHRLLGSGSGENGNEAFMYGHPSITVNTYGVGSVDSLAHTGREKGPQKIQF